MLLAHGGYRPMAETVFPTVLGRPVVQLLAEACILDPIFVLHPTEGCKSHILDKDRVTYQLVTDVCFVLDLWTHGIDGPGREESFVHTFRKFFPLHEPSEMEYLRSQWGSWRHLLRCSTVGYTPEQEPKKIMDDSSDDGVDADKFEVNTFGSNCPGPLGAFKRP